MKIKDWVNKLRLDIRTVVIILLLVGMLYGLFLKNSNEAQAITVAKEYMLKTYYSDSKIKQTYFYCEAINSGDGEFIVNGRASVEYHDSNTAKVHQPFSVRIRERDWTVVAAKLEHNL